MSNFKGLLSFLCQNKNYEQIESLLKLDIFKKDINFSSINVANPLHISIKNNDIHLSKLLLENGSNIESSENSSFSYNSIFNIQCINLTPFGHSLFKGHREIAQLFIKNGCKLEGNYSLQPLHIACLTYIEFNVNNVDLLLHNSDINSIVKDTINYENYTALHFAFEGNCFDLATLLIENGGTVYYIRKCIKNVSKNGNDKIINLFTKYIFNNYGHDHDLHIIELYITNLCLSKKWSEIKYILETYNISDSIPNEYKKEYMKYIIEIMNKKLEHIKYQHIYQTIISHDKEYVMC